MAIFFPPGRGSRLRFFFREEKATPVKMLADGALQSFLGIPKSSWSFKIAELPDPVPTNLFATLINPTGFVELKDRQKLRENLSQNNVTPFIEKDQISGR